MHCESTEQTSIRHGVDHVDEHVGFWTAHLDGTFGVRRREESSAVEITESRATASSDEDSVESSLQPVLYVRPSSFSHCPQANPKLEPQVAHQSWTS